MKLPLTQEQKESFVRILTKPYSIASLPGTQLDILKYLALLGPEPDKKQTKYKIQIETKINHASVSEATSKLTEMKALKSEYVGTSRAHQPMFKYKPTLKGVFMSLSRCDQRDGLIDHRIYKKIAEKWSQKEPILLGKYRYLSDILGEEVAKAIIFYNAWNGYAYVEECSEIAELRQVVISELFERVRRVIDQFNWSMEELETAETYKKLYGEANPAVILEKLIEAFTGNSELNRYMEQYLEEVFEKAKEEENWGNFIKRKLIEVSKK